MHIENAFSISMYSLFQVCRRENQSAQERWPNVQADWDVSTPEDTCYGFRTLYTRALALELIARDLTLGKNCKEISLVKM